MSRRKILSTLMLLFLVNGAAWAQDSWTDKVTWTFKVVKVDENHADIVATAKLKEHWHVFSMDHDPAKADFTGMPTNFKFKPNANYRLVGKMKDGKTPKAHEDVLGLSLIFEGSGVFKQRIEVLSEDAFKINFEYEFQVCDENGCLFPPAQDASVEIKGYQPISKEEQEQNLVITGDVAKDKEGNQYIMHKDKWVRVPEGNSIEFYKEYLKLGGSYE